MKSPPETGATGVRQLEIDESRSGQRLDNYLIGVLKGVPKSRIYRLLRKGEVRVNRGRAKPDYRLQAGDVVRLPPVRMTAAPDRVREGKGYEWLGGHILYEDEYLLALNKPAGLAVHSGTGIALGVIEVLRALRPNAPMLELAHRLDRDTSGCLLLAKTRPALLDLHRQLREGGMRKHYAALVKGVWRGRMREVAVALETDSRRARGSKVQAREEGKEAVSRFTPKQVYGPATLVDIELLTGRTHQARVHAAHIGHPIAGDDKYGDWDFNRAMRAQGLKRLFLHAARLEFRHPITRGKLRFEAPLPPDLSAFLEQLA
jgi:23S rRNA pseudouridine955/2504/2580 synthase